MADGRANNGGARPNSGPKPKAERHETAIQTAEKRCADRLPITLHNLEEIADGLVEDVDEQWVAAGMATIGKGNNERLAFPELAKTEPFKLVLVSKKVIKRGPDVRANMYLADRVMGKPADGDEQKIRDVVGAELNAFAETIRENFEPDLAERILSTIGNANAPKSDSAGSSKERA